MINLFTGIRNIFGKYSGSRNTDGANTILSTVFPPLNQYTVPVTKGTYIWTGLNTLGKNSYKVSVTSSSYTWTGRSITAIRTFKVAVTTLSHELAIPNVKIQRNKVVSTLSYTLTNNDVNKSSKVVVNSVNNVWTGRSVVIGNDYVSEIPLTTFTYTPNQITKAIKFKVPKVGYYLYAQIPDIIVHYSIPITSQSFVLDNSYTIEIISSNVIVVDSLSYTATFNSVVGISGSLNVPKTAFNYTSSVTGYQYSRVVPIESKTLNLTPYSIDFKVSKSVLIDSIDYTYSTSSVSLLRQYVFTISSTSYNYSPVGISTLRQDIIGIESANYMYSPSSVLNYRSYVISSKGLSYSSPIESIQVKLSKVVSSVNYSYSASNVSSSIGVVNTIIPVTATSYTYSSGTISHGVGKIIQIPTFNLTYHMNGLDVIRHISVKISTKSYNLSINELKISRNLPITGLPFTYTTENTDLQYLNIFGREDISYLNHVINIKCQRITSVDTSYIYLSSSDILAKAGIETIPISSTPFSMSANSIESRKQWNVTITPSNYVLYRNTIYAYRNLDTLYSKLPQVYVTMNNEQIYTCTTNDRVHISDPNDKVYLSQQY